MPARAPNTRGCAPMQGVCARLRSKSRAAAGRKDARVILRRHFFSLLGAAIAALVLSLGASAPGAAARQQPKPHKLTKHQKAALRRQLRRALKRNPAVALRRDFLKKAQVADLNLPLTLRLARSGQGPTDDQLGVTWTSETFPWPAGFAELDPAPDNTPPGGVIPLDGTSSLEA